MGGPRFPRAKRQFEEMDDFSKDPTELSGENLDAVPQPFEEEGDRKSSRKKRDLSGETIIADEVIDLRNVDATDRLTLLQESLPPGSMTDPNDTDIIPNDAEITEEDELELTKALERSAQITERSNKMSFEDSPKLWRNDRFKEDIGELLRLHHVGIDESALRNIMEKQADEYEALFKKLSHDAATGDTMHSEATGPEFSREVYLAELQEVFSLRQPMSDRGSNSNDETRKIALSEDEDDDITNETPL